jgi:hypothetical protein
MNPRASWTRRVIGLMLSLCAMGAMPATAAAQQGHIITLAAEKQVKQLPAGPLFWQVENFSTLMQAQSAAGETSLAVEAAGKVWLFTLGPMGGSRHGGSKIVEIGPVLPTIAPEYLLRINYASAPPDTMFPAHAHPGSVAFYVLAGRLGQITPRGVKHAWVGQAMNGHGADTPVEVFSSGTSDLNALIMFVEDGTKPLSPPGNIE